MTDEGTDIARAISPTSIAQIIEATQGIKPSRQRKSYLASQYIVLRKIQPAQCGDVLLAEHRATHRHVAIKEARFDVARRKHIPRDAICYERQILASMAIHNNIVTLLESFEESDCLYLVFEYCQGDLYDIIDREDHMSDMRARRYVRDIAQALQHMHQQGFVHRDVSLENILLDAHDRCKLCDFGVAQCISVFTEYVHIPVGKVGYAAPEIEWYEEGQVVDLKKADVWSLGVVFFMLLTGDALYPPVCERSTAGATGATGVTRLVGRTIVEQCEIDKTLHSYATALSMLPETIDLLHHILVIDPSQRFDIHDVLNHPSLVHIESYR